MAVVGHRSGVAALVGHARHQFLPVHRHRCRVPHRVHQLRDIAVTVVPIVQRRMPVGVCHPVHIVRIVVPIRLRVPQRVMTADEAALAVVSVRGRVP